MYNDTGILKLGMLVECGTLIKSEIAKPKHFILQDIKRRGEICVINSHYFWDGGRVWGVKSKHRNFPFFRTYDEGGGFIAINFIYFRDGGRV